MTYQASLVTQVRQGLEISLSALDSQPRNQIDKAYCQKETYPIKWKEQQKIYVKKLLKCNRRCESKMII